MGCAESRQKYDQADIVAQNVATSQSFKTLPGVSALTAPTTLTLGSKMFRLREDIDVLDANGNVMAKLLGKYLSLRDRQIVADASGKKVLVMIRKVLTFKPAFYFYSFEPNFEGQESTETEGGEPLYKFAILQSVLFSIPPRWNYSLFTKSNDDHEKVAEVSAICQLLYTSGSVYGLDGSPLVKLTQTSLFGAKDVKGVAAGFDVEIAAGMDPIQAIAVCMAAPQTLENNN